MILIVLKIQIRPDRRDVWFERIAKYTAAVRDEPGNLSFDVYESLDAPNEFSIVEGFASKEAGDAHVHT
ncbi:MAG: antibiotic biosynthesis monooxygenase, partial [Actinobacteria bacterium]|nr:antibiotic biosynthesis monooxygenase [Actinomycetota bacterium]